jgi:1D-myo-inositol-triphosphate 3-kinase
LIQEAFSKLANDPLHNLVPECTGIVERDGVEYLQLRNLLYGFNNPSVMDCKIGFRYPIMCLLRFAEAVGSPKNFHRHSTYLNADVKDGVPRMDLLDKMAKLAPDEPTPDERVHGVVKRRYLQVCGFFVVAFGKTPNTTVAGRRVSHGSCQFRDELSSSATLGFRIEAIRTLHSRVDDLHELHDKDDVMAQLRVFLGDRPAVKQQFVLRLDEIRATLEASEFFASHEVCFETTMPVQKPLTHVFLSLKIGGGQLGFVHF